MPFGEQRLLVQQRVPRAPHACPFGGKGPGEMCANPVLPAIANAIFNAVGVRIDELPMTPEKVLRAIKAQGGARPVGQSR